MEIQLSLKKKGRYWSNFCCAVAVLTSGVDLNQFHYMQKDSDFLGQILPKCIFPEFSGKWMWPADLKFLPFPFCVIKTCKMK